jgi:tetrapyrrole methylase family protein / MazG family protein
MADAGRTYLRTARHPGTERLPPFVSLDHHYESAATFEEVYLAVVEELVDAASALAPAPIVYAVPGSPLVAERTVELLRLDERVDLTVVPGLSFLDLAWERLAVDPVRAGARLVDAEQFGARTAAGGGPYLVAQCWSQTLLSDIKLSLILEQDDLAPDVVLLHHLGLPDEQVVRVGWWDLDRTVRPDHLTSLYIAELPAPPGAGRQMTRLEELVRTLRERCPWDRAQTHGSLMPHLLEESYEVLDALGALAAADAADGAGDAAAPSGHLREELGDLLFQIVFHAQLAHEAGRFDLADVARGVHDKLVHRHPHVFGDSVAATSEQVVANWEEIKKEEKGRSSVTEGIPMDLPALLLSTKLQRKALSVHVSDLDLHVGGIGLPDRVADLEKMRSRVSEGEGAADPSGDSGATELLVGDVLFEMAGLSRRLGIDPEQALRTRALAFLDRLKVLEEDTSGVRLPDAGTH